LDRNGLGAVVPIFECARCNELTYSASAESAQACPRCGDHRHRVLSGGFADARDTTRDLAPGDHATHVYDDPALVAPFCARYLTEGIDKDERVMAAAPEDLRAVTERLLAPDVNVLVEWQDPRAIYGDFDADRIAGMYDALIGSEPRHMRILAVCARDWASGADPVEWNRYERMGHDIVTRHGATVICMYDTRGLDPAFLDVAAHRHPLSVDDGVVRRNESFEFQPV
jgi:DNA-directed RNA polymerase subunit RPC12/RpoP